MPGNFSIAYGTRTGARQAITYGAIEKGETELAARIYVQSFPWRVRRWFGRQGPAIAFYRDLFELMRLAHGKSFLAARKQGELVGFLILTLPDTNLFRAACREGFCLRLAWHAIAGQYGYSFSLLAVALKGLTQGSYQQRPELLRGPHVYVVVVRQQDTGKGIGSALIEQARTVCHGRYGQIWLYVEGDNAEAIRLYERIGFRIVESDPTQHAMVWNLPAEQN